MGIEIQMEMSKQQIRGPYQVLSDEEYGEGPWVDAFGPYEDLASTMQDINESDVSSEYSSDSGENEKSHILHELQSTDSKSPESRRSTYLQQDEQTRMSQRKARNLLRKAQAKLEMIAHEMKNHRKQKTENNPKVEEA